MPPVATTLAWAWAPCHGTFGPSKGELRHLTQLPGAHTRSSSGKLHESSPRALQGGDADGRSRPGNARPCFSLAYPRAMCMTYPGQVLEVADGMALVEIDRRRRRASLVLTPEVAVGDWVIVAAGTVLEVVDPDEATEIVAMLDQARQAEGG